MKLLATLATAAIFSSTRADSMWGQDFTYGGRFSNDASNCYNAANVTETVNGITANLAIAGDSCNAYGEDIQRLVIEAVYENKERLHVKIYDEDQRQFQVPEEIFERPSFSADESLKLGASDLVFDYQTEPFGFWVSRRSNGDILFDTRPQSINVLPEYDGETDDVLVNKSSIATPNFVFEDQFIQLSSKLPYDANIYGLAEHYSSSGYREDPHYTHKVFWAFDNGTPGGSNLYGTYPFYVEARNDQASGETLSHGVFWLSSGGLETWLRDETISYRAISGIVDLYFFSGGTSPDDVTRQYTDLSGKPTETPRWAFGNAITRWGYKTEDDARSVVDNMRAANIPLETLFLDIDWFEAKRNFIADPTSWGHLKELIQDLYANHQSYVPIIDFAVAIATNDSDDYETYRSGHEQDVFLKNEEGSEYIGYVWPGYTVFPDFLAENTSKWWNDEFKIMYDEYPFSGIWLDMTEPSSFCVGSCGTGENLDALGQYVAEAQTQYPEGYDQEKWGPSGNMTINGTSTYSPEKQEPKKRNTFEAIDGDYQRLKYPPYLIHNGSPQQLEALDNHGLAVNATNSRGWKNYDYHNANGHLAAKLTHDAIENAVPGDQRSFILARSTFAGSQKYTQHWLGDNYSSWQSLRDSISGILQFSLSGLPFVGADACGFSYNSDEELCNRWTAAAAFTPFFRNHNTNGTLPQEYFRWDTVADTARTVSHARYQLLPYIYSIFQSFSDDGSSLPMRALWYDEKLPDYQLFNNTMQFKVGEHLQVSPVLFPNTTTVESAQFPSLDGYYDYFTHQHVSGNQTIALDAPLSTINVHVRGGGIIPLHQQPDYTIYETRQHPFDLLVALSDVGQTASGYLIDDDGISNNAPRTQVNFSADGKSVTGHAVASNFETQPLSTITVLGVKNEPSSVTANGVPADFNYNAALMEIVIENLNFDLRRDFNVNWE